MSGSTMRSATNVRKRSDADPPRTTVKSSARAALSAGERDERNDRRDGEGDAGRHARAPAARGEERHEPEQHEHLPDRAREDERDDAETEAPPRGQPSVPPTARMSEERDERERGREQRVARELVEEQDVARVREQRDGRRQRRDRAEAAGDAEPGDDRERVQHGEADLAHDGAALEQQPDDEPACPASARA